MDVISCDWGIDQGHEVFSVFDEARGADDDAIIEKASNENWILISVIQAPEMERETWLNFSAQGLAAAYDDDEPERWSRSAIRNMREGDIVLTPVPQANAQIKKRLLKNLSDYLIK